MTASIRPASASDVGASASLLAELGYPASEEALARRLALLIPRTDYRVLVAERDGEVAGLGAVHVFPAIHSDHALAFIAALVVSAAARGSGIGARIVREMEMFAISHGCDRILVTTANHRDGAFRFYERLGYDFTGRRYAKRIR
jgi:ribosomal protein S18 acetylase RimI-like enzyme